MPTACSKETMGDHIQGLAKVQAHNMSVFHLPHGFSNLFLVLQVPGDGCRRTCPITFPGTEGKLTSLSVSKSSFLPFLKTGLIFAFSEDLGTSLISLAIPKCFLERGLTMTPASSTSTYLSASAHTKSLSMSHASRGVPRTQHMPVQVLWAGSKENQK
ncbi:hypothetical protein QYF61_021339 [Mycteria americana]|uniref:Uncharacterized protein n=1 Tax=Mycteria americana TaxID=33587 RepID=A0AAN7MAR5_MYCAM|nr:hypothetical protein QYF61_021339 [Mycteria americana]